MRKVHKSIYLSMGDYLNENNSALSDVKGIPELSEDQKNLIIDRAVLENIQVYIGEGVSNKEIDEMFAIHFKEIYQTIIKEEKDLLVLKLDRLKEKEQLLLSSLTKDGTFDYTEELRKYNQQEEGKLSALSPQEVVQINSLLIEIKTNITKAEFELKDQKDNISILQDQIDKEKQKTFKGKEPMPPVLFTGKLEGLNSCEFPLEPIKKENSEHFVLTPSNYFKEKGINVNYLPIRTGTDLVISEKEKDYIDAKIIPDEPYVVLDAEVAELIKKIDSLIGRVDTMLKKIEVFREENDFQRTVENETVSEALDGKEIPKTKTDDIKMGTDVDLQEAMSKQTGEVKQLVNPEAKKTNKKRLPTRKRGM